MYVDHGEFQDLQWIILYGLRAELPSRNPV